MSKEGADTAAMEKLKVSEQVMELSMLALQNPGLLVALLADVSKSSPGFVFSSEVEVNSNLNSLVALVQFCSWSVSVAVP